MQSNRARFLAALFAALCLLSLAAACSRSADDEDDAAGGGDDAGEAVALTPYKPTGQEGSVAGAVSFAGASPAKKGISMDADPVCASSNSDPHAEDIVINGDKVANVFVYIKEGTTGGKSISGYQFAAAAQPAVLDQKGCQYVPHVVGVQVNQTLNVTNSDPTAHNVNVDARQNEKFNQGQSPGAAPINKTFKRAETVIPVKCNQHPWMKAYVGVLKHPFFAVSGADGSFTIKDVPPGKYTVVAWHEKFGEQTMEVTVPDSGAGTANFSFDSSKTVAELTGGSLELLPALEFPMMMGMHH